MERELWSELYSELLRFDRCVGVKGEYFSDGAIAATQLWAAVHDRPTSWACRRENWSSVEPPIKVPNPPEAEATAVEAESTKIASRDAPGG